MSETAHTPGPWSYDADNEMLLGSDGLAIGHVEPASGPLAAAAPNMLAALKQIVVYADTSTDPGIVSVAKAAIEKADGRS